MLDRQVALSVFRGGARPFEARHATAREVKSAISGPPFRDACLQRFFENPTDGQYRKHECRAALSFPISTARSVVEAGVVPSQEPAWDRAKLEIHFSG